MEDQKLDFLLVPVSFADFRDRDGNTWVRHEDPQS